MVSEPSSRSRVDEAELPDLWARKAKGDQGAVARLAEIYLWRADRLARSKKVPEAVEMDDLISWARFGLFDAIRKFDPSASDGKNWHGQFYAFASMRIRGAILDGLKSPNQSWASRQAWRLLQQQRDAEGVLAQELGRTPSRAELAEYLGVPREDLASIKQIVPVGGTAFDGDSEDDQHGESSWVGLADTEAEAVTRLIPQRCAAALGRLCADDQEVLCCRYLQGQKASPEVLSGALGRLRLELAGI